MSLTQEKIKQILDRFQTTQANHQPIEAIDSFMPDMTAAEAYQVQAALISRIQSKGHSIAGNKAAATSAAAQAKMGVNEPICGSLFDYQKTPSASSISTEHFIQPLIECELGFVMGQPISGPGVDEAKVIAATSHIVAAFDIIDFSTNDAVSMREALCYNVFTVNFVLGEQSATADSLDLPNLAIRLDRNGETVDAATGDAVMGHPARSVAWLINKLAELGRGLEAGQVVLTGAITSPYPIEEGDRFVATYDILGQIEVQFT